MKILKPGKVEMRKFVCPKCGCVFVAMPSDREYALPDTMFCPQDGCDSAMRWDNGEPYEGPTPAQSDRARLRRILSTANPIATASELTNLLIDNGVTFREDAR